MRIEWATFCLGVVETEKGTHLLGIQKNWVRVPEPMPCIAKALVAVMFSVPYEDMGSDVSYVLWHRVLGPEFDSSVEWTAIRQWGAYAPAAMHPRGIPGHETYKLDLAFLVERTGIHTIQLMVDEQVPFSLPLFLSEGAPT